MKRTLLLFGWKPHSIRSIKRALPEAPLLVLEEPSLAPREEIPGACYVPARYHQSDEAVEIAREFARVNNIAAVVPLREYTTPAANAVARALGMPRLGDLAAQVFRDKMVLRRTVELAGTRHFAQPVFAPLETAEEAADFVVQHGTSILKPSNRQSTVGVFRVDTPEQARVAFADSVASKEPGRIPDDRALAWRHHIETFVDGSEYSTELFFDRGRAVFTNCTCKRTHAGAPPYEIGHLLPLSRLNTGLNARLIEAAKELASICQVGSGAMHAEWLVQDDRIYLVESAGRPPGCFITDLINEAYGIDYFGLFVSVLTRPREAPPLPMCDAEPSRFCAMRWFDPKPGRIKHARPPADFEKSGIALLQCAVTAQKGEVIALANNHTRVGHAIAAGQDASAVEAFLDTFAEQTVVTEQQQRALV